MQPVSCCSPTWPYYGCNVYELARLEAHSALPEPSLTSCVEEPYSDTASASRLNDLRGLLDRLRTFSPAELELAWWMSQLEGHNVRYAADTSGLMYLNAAVLSGQTARQLRLNTPYRPTGEVDQVGPMERARFDRTV